MKKKQDMSESNNYTSAPTKKVQTTAGLNSTVKKSDVNYSNDPMGLLKNKNMSL